LSTGRRRNICKSGGERVDRDKETRKRYNNKQMVEGREKKNKEELVKL
jgi:hypothetical protein